MANKYTTLAGLFKGIADAIRSKTGSTDTIVADNFPEEIANLQTSFDYINHDVTMIPDNAFKGCEDLISVDCMNLTSVGANAFENCTNLRTIILYDGLESIGSNAFEDCTSLTTITIPDSVERVGENAFRGCDNAIIYCKASSQPDTWHENWNPDNRPVLYGELVGTWDISATEADNVTLAICDSNSKYTLFVHGSGNMKSYRLSNGMDISPWSSYKTDIASVVVCDGVTSVASGAFEDCTRLTSVTIPSSITTIGTHAFSNCYSMTSVTVPDSVATIGEQAFYNCQSLTYVTIPDSVTSINRRTFCNCYSLTSITIPSSVTTIGEQAFLSCYHLTDVTIPDSVTSIKQYALQDCYDLESITFTGTISQWKTIKFGYNWSAYTGDYTIYCTDGDIAKDGTITYH